MKNKTLLFFAVILSLATSPSLARAQMTYPPTLTDERTGQSISASTTKCIILIHGWNPSGAANCYDINNGFEWFNLITDLKLQLNGSSWGLVTYHWEIDAATGNIWDSLWNFEIVPASTAAFNADAHGAHLASQLNQLAPNLREVHFIAHSAGSWAARSAAQQLLQLNPYVVVQVTLLDPFIPDPSGLLYGGDFSDSAMSGMQSFSGNDRIQRLENYYANDDPLTGWNPAPWGSLTGPTYNTQETFSWRNGIDINQEVDWGTRIGVPSYTPNYDWHAGPIQFLSDCVNANLFPTTVPSGLQGAGCPFVYQQIGWQRSLYAWESVLPQITAQPANQSGQTGGSTMFSVSANLATAYDWYKVGGSYVGSGSSLTLNNLSSGDAGSYVVRVSNANGQLYSQPATLTVGAATLAITSVSPAALTGLPLPQTQLFKIYGSGFTASSTLTFNDGVDSPFTGRVPTFVSASELDYNIAVGTNQANWTVQVINGAQQSNLGYFTVAAPPPPTSGSLIVTVSPSGAVSAGAQWQVDSGAYHASGAVVTNLTPGSHTVACTSVSGYTTPTSHSVTISGGSVTTDTETYTSITATTGSITVNISPSSAVSAGAQWSVDGGGYHSSGATVTGLSVGLHSVSFTYVSGYSSPSSISVSVAGGLNSTYSVDYGCTYSLSPTSASFDTLADGGSFTVTSPGGCGWTATTGYSWIHTSGSGNGNGTVSYTVDANVSTNSRSGTIWVGGQAFLINQLGVEEVIAWGPTALHVPRGLTNVAAIADGHVFYMALKSNGTVFVWGDNSYGQTNVPAGLTNVVAISCGSDGGSGNNGSFCLALKANGIVCAWGDNTHGQTNVPVGLTNVVAIAGGGGFCLALKSDGSVVGWGEYYQYAWYPMSTAIPWGLTNVVAIAAGGLHALAITSDGNIVSWGWDFQGWNEPPGGLSGVVGLTTGSQHQLALKNNGTVVAWGYNNYGSANVPTGLTNVVNVAAGDTASVAVKADGTVSAWGGYYYYVSGFGYSIPEDSSLVVPTNLSNIATVAVGYDDALALLANGSPRLTTPRVKINQSFYANSGTLLLYGSATGKLPLSYQWQHNGTNLLGATAQSLLLTNVLPPAAGIYTVVITNSIGAITSSPAATLTVLTNPVILLQPYSEQVFAGDSTYFSVSAEGPNPITYQWLKNGTPLTDDGRVTGSATSFLNFANTTMPDAGNYSVVVTSPYASITSSIVALTMMFPLSQALEATNLSWSTWGYAGWITETNITHGGAWAAQSGYIGNSQYSSMGTTVVGPGTLTFWWKVSSEAGYDFLEFYGSGRYASISGEEDWQQVSFKIDPGYQYLEWDYTKDASVYDGLDAGWVDQVTFVPFQMTAPARQADGSIQIGLAGTPAGTYIIFASSNLVDWLPILTNSVPFGGTNITDPASKNIPIRFYRAQQP